jgi:hypothetical protein
MTYMKQSLIVLICGFLGATVLVNSRSLSALPKDRTSPVQKTITVPEAFLPHTTPGAGAPQPLKICSGVHELSFSWRDTIIAPNDWKAATCQNFANSLGASQYQLGCANPSSFSWGGRDGSSPADNKCGW